MLLYQSAVVYYHSKLQVAETMKAAPVSRPTNSDRGCKDIPNCKEDDSFEHPQEPRRELRLPFFITCYHNDTTSLSQGNLISSSSTECSSSVGDISLSSNLLSSSLCDGFDSDTNFLRLCNEGESDQEQEGDQDDDEEEERRQCTTLSLSLHCHNSSSSDDDEDDSICRQSDSIDGESLSSDESIRDRFTCPAMIWTKIPDGNHHRKRYRFDKGDHHPEQHRDSSTSSTSSRLITKRRRTKKRKLEISNRGDRRDREYIVWKRANRNTPIIRDVIF